MAISPLSKLTTPEQADIYGLPPHQQPADVYEGEGYEGRGGWAWYTGSAARMISAAYAMLGFEIGERRIATARRRFRAKGRAAVRKREFQGQGFRGARAGGGNGRGVKDQSGEATLNRLALRASHLLPQGGGAAAPAKNQAAAAQAASYACTTIEKATQTKVTSTISSRSGKLAGSDSTSASASAPRSPPHHRTNCSPCVIRQRETRKQRRDRIDGNGARRATVMARTLA